MRQWHFWLSLVVLTIPGLGQRALAEGEEAIAEPAEPAEIVVELKSASPTEKVRLGYSSPRRMAVEMAVPRFLFEVPKFACDDPAFFRVALGETEGVPFYGALDKSKGALYHDLLYLDKNRDLDLTNDGDPIPARIRTLWTNESKLIEFLGVSLELPYKIAGKNEKETYPCVVYFVLPGSKAAPPKHVMLERDGWREGSLKLGDGEFRIAVIDDDSDGQFSTGDSWVVRAASVPREQMLSRDATRKMIFPSWSADQKWTVEVKGIDAAGRKLTLSVTPAKETERQYFEKIYKARQDPAERARNLDPMRPKIAADKKVDWIVGKGADYAIEIAAKDQTPNRVLLDFTQRTCPHCHAMNTMTMRDREVFQLTKRFVCAKIGFKQGEADTVKYRVDGTPTYVIVDNRGAEIARHVGFLRPTEFAAWLKSALR